MRAPLSVLGRDIDCLAVHPDYSLHSFHACNALTSLQETFENDHLHNLLHLVSSELIIYGYKFRKRT